MFMDVGGIPAVMQSAGRDDREGGMGGQWWIFALVIVFFALIFWRRDGSENRNPLSDVAALNALGNNNGDQRAAFTEINGRFDAVTQQVGHINDVNDLRDLKRTQSDLSLQVANNRTDTLLNFKELTTTVMNGNCDVRRDIDTVNYNNAKNTCEIIAAVTAGTQRVIDNQTANEMNRLREELANRDRQILSRDIQIGQERQADRVIGTVAPRANPSYTVYPPGPLGHYDYFHNVA